MRPASPAHTYDPYADDEHVGVADRSDPYDTYHPESVRRIAPPPPPDFVAREERERSRYHEPGPGADRYSTAQHNPESRWEFCTHNTPGTAARGATAAAAAGAARGRAGRGVRGPGARGATPRPTPAAPPRAPAAARRPASRAAQLTPAPGPAAAGSSGSRDTAPGTGGGTSITLTMQSCIHGDNNDTDENSDGSNILPCRKSTAPLHKRLAGAREGKRPSRDEKHRRR